MMPRTVHLIDAAHQIVAVAHVTETAGLCRGQIELAQMLSSMQRTFEQYEEIVSNQTFSLLDEIEDRVNALGIKVETDDQQVSEIEDLQIYPSTGRVSYRLRQASPPMLHTADKTAHVEPGNDRPVSRH